MVSEVVPLWYNIDMKEHEAGYWAGIFDGEGSLFITAGGKAHRSIVRVVVGNTNEWLILALHISFGGSWKKRRSQNSFRHKSCFLWIVEGPQAVAYLRVIRPYVMLKKAQVELAITFQERKTTSSRILGTNRLTAEERALREADRILMGTLNRKGPQQ